MLNLCLTLAEQSSNTLVRKIAHYKGKVAFIEVRLDYLSKPVIPALPIEKATQFVATCRPRREGGRYVGPERDRLELLQQAARSGFDWVDLEHDVATSFRCSPSTRIIRSSHCFEQFPADLSSCFRDLRKLGGDVTKLAVFVSSTRELVALLEWMESIPPEIPRLILGMGEFGQPSRFLGAFFGNCWTYVAESKEVTVAPGQFTLKQALESYRMPSWEGFPSFYGVLGNPLGHSLSPTLHNRLFQHHGLKKMYMPCQVDDLDAWFGYVNRSHCSFQGFSVTRPFKAAVVKHLQQVESSVKAVNTLRKEGSGWEGFNTDYPGFLKPLQSKFSLKGKTAVVLGNGGVAHTVMTVLQNAGVQVTVVGRNSNKVSRFAAEYGCRHALFSDLSLRTDLCINTTPVGQFPEVGDSPLTENQLDFEVVYDLVYRPEKTQLLRMAEQKGLRTISGMEMFIEQAALQFAAWTQIDPDRELIRDMIRQANRT